MSGRNHDSWEECSGSFIGQIYSNQGQYEQALDHYNEALTIYKQIEDRVNQVLTLGSIGLIYLSTEQYEQALPYLEQKLTIFRELGLELPAFEGNIINSIGLSYFKTGQYDEAFSHYSESLTIFRQINDHTQQIVTLNAIGDVYLFTGQYDEASSHYQEALTIISSQEINDRAQKATALKNMAQVYLNWGQYDQALQLPDEAGHIWPDNPSLDHVREQIEHSYASDAIEQKNYESVFYGMIMPSLIRNCIP